MEIAVLTMIVANNATTTTAALCPDGRPTSGKCTLVAPPDQFLCTSDPAGSSCERFNGTFHCCPRAAAANPASACVDRSKFCSFLGDFCGNSKHEWIMRRECAQSCGFCGEAAPADSSIQLLRLNGSAPLRRYPRPVVHPVVSGNNNKEFEKRAAVNGVLPLARSSSRLSPDIKVSSQVIFGNDIFPAVETAEPDQLPVSLAKTIIRGTCFDEYTYCREFVALCTHPTFSFTMAKRCSLTCDRCEDMPAVLDPRERKNCTDTVRNCAEHRPLCQNDNYRQLLRGQCARTCEFCLPTCRDRHANCPQYKKDGFCSDGLYSLPERAYLCGNACNLCEEE